MSTRGQEDKTIDMEKVRKSLSTQMYLAFKSQDPAKKAEVRKKVESSTKTTQKKIDQFVRLLEWKEKNNEFAKRPDGAEGEN